MRPGACGRARVGLRGRQVPAYVIDFGGSRIPLMLDKTDHIVLTQKGRAGDLCVTSGSTMWLILFPLPARAVGRWGALNAAGGGKVAFSFNTMSKDARFDLRFVPSSGRIRVRVCPPPGCVKL